MPAFPILDLEKDPPPLQRRWITWLASIAIGVGFVSIVNIDSASWVPALFLSVAVHEIGHLVAGKLVGMNPGGIVVCGFMILRSGPGWRFQFDWRRVLSGGLAQPLPKMGDFAPRRYALMVAGGPIATLLTAAIAGIAWKAYDEPAGWLSSLFWLNLVLFAGILVPMSGPNKTDGPRIWMLLRQPEESRRWMAMLQLLAQDSQGVEPRDWDAELVELALSYDSAAPEQAAREMFALYRRADLDDDAGVLEHIERALVGSGRCGKLVRHWCFSEAAAISALIRGNPAAARTWMARARKVRRPESTDALEAAIAQSEGRFEDAAKSWDAALAFLTKRKLDSGIARLSRRRMTEYREQCLAAIGSAEKPALRAQASTV